MRCICPHAFINARMHLSTLLLQFLILICILTVIIIVIIIIIIIITIISALFVKKIGASTQKIGAGTKLR